MMQYTIDSDDEVPLEVDSEGEEEEKVTVHAAKGKAKKGKAAMFSIDFDTGELPATRPVAKKVKQRKTEEELEDGIPQLKDDKLKTMAHIEQRLARNAAKQKDSATAESEDSAAESDSDSDGEEENYMNEEDEQAYFDVVVDTKKNGEHKDIDFSQLNLSRPFLRAIEAMGYTQPTPIQAQVIPYALAGRDICASAVTGSGKTAAFVLPFLERLLYRPRDVPATRVLIITPTRELAMQIHEVMVKLSQFTDISCLLICGGKKDVRSQEASLRARPDVVICTPGRMVDHLRNSLNITLDDLDVLVLDEVDRLLDLGFQLEVEELVRYCPQARQTMLFSATMTPKVEDLIKLSLKRPVRVKVDGKATTIAPRLVQEFVKVRNPDEVECILLSLLCRDFGKKTIVFFELKRLAHRFSAVLNLMNVKAVELHGDLPQAQRFLALQKFRDGEVDVLVATDVAARGLDIQGVLVVINAEMPRNVSTYIHRVGRTARAGCGGRSITLVTDDRRKIMKEVLKSDATRGLSAEQSHQVLSRTIPASVMAHYAAKRSSIEGQVESFLRDEWTRLKLESMEREAERAENLLEHADEIKNRPARTWFQTEKQKEGIREKLREHVEEEKQIAAHGRKQLSAEEKARLLAAQDDYRAEEEDSKAAGKHRLSRKKRRRMEALKEIEADEEEKGTQVSLSAPKRAKSAAREKEEVKKDRSLSEMTMKKVWVTEDVRDEGDMDGDDGEAVAKKASKKRLKVVRQKFAVGGLDLDDDWGGAKADRLRKKAAPEPTFKEFDASKYLRKGGKKGNATFKSKGRYKRRK
eukprot:gene5723-6307_t